MGKGAGAEYVEFWIREQLSEHDIEHLYGGGFSTIFRRKEGLVDDFSLEHIQVLFFLIKDEAQVVCVLCGCYLCCLYAHL